MNGRTKAFMVISLAATMAVGAFMFSLSRSANLTSADPDDYSLSMSASSNRLYDGSVAATGNATLKTKAKADVSFAYAAVKGKDSVWQAVENNGYFENADPIHSLTRIVLTFDESNLDFSLSYSKDETLNASKDLITSSEQAVSFDFEGARPNYFRLTNKSGQDLSIVSVDLYYTCFDEPASSSQEAMTWDIVTEASDLVDGRQVVIGNISKSVLAGPVTSTKSNSYLASVSASFSSDKKHVESMDGDTLIFTLKSAETGWNLVKDDKYLAPIGEKKVSLVDSSFAWNITFKDGVPTLGAGSAYGSLQYNVQNPRFTVYTSSQGAVAIFQSSTGTPSSSSSASSSASSSSSAVPTSSTTPTSSQSSSSSPSSPAWQLVTSTNDLVVGDSIVFACNNKGMVAGSLGANAYLSAVSATFSSDKSEIVELPSNAEVFTLGTSGNYWTFGVNEDLLGVKSANTLAMGSGTSTWSIAVSNGNATITSSTSSYGSIQYNASSPRFRNYTSSQTAIQLYRLPSEPVYPTAISLSGLNEVQVGKTSSVSVSFTPSNTNQKDIEWSSSNTAIATVNNGRVTGVAIGSCTITATAYTESHAPIQASIDITVSEAVLDAYTIMIYMCGSNLESYDSQTLQYGSQGSLNLAEIVSVEDIPSNVNILVETGGANDWDPSFASTLGATIDPQLTRWTIQDQKLVKEPVELQPADEGMDKASTYQDFLTWGLENYPAAKTGVILWNHGGALDGCCFDERDGDKSLTIPSAYSATKAAFAATGTEKLEWVGYDCCLMSVQDIAEMNSDFYNYQITSQESEPGGGWDYDAWVAEIAKDPTIDTVSLGKVICDSFKQKCADDYNYWAETYPQQYGDYKNYNDATLAVLDLTKMGAYKTAWEAMAASISSIITTSNKWNAFANIVNQAEKYGYYSESWASSYNGGYIYDIFNVSTFLSKLSANATYSSVDVSSVIAALANLVAYNAHGKDSPNACGLCFFCPISGYNAKSIYSTSQTRFTAWRSLVINYGNWY